MAIDDTRLVTPAAMGAIDAAAARGGIDSFTLMQAAGAHVAAVVLAHYPDALRVVVVCGPGNNGGDGHVAARLLMQSGVAVARFGAPPKPGGDAARAFTECPGSLAPLEDWQPRAGDVVIDALFGAGLDRAVGDDVAAVIARAEATGTPVVAVDLPSGLSGRTGAPTGPCFRAEHTVTFAARKPGHLLMPGRALCGRLHLCDIGIPARLIASDDRLWRNHPGLYSDHLPVADAAAHKYTHGHLAVFSGPLISSGAARLAAVAGLRAGAGLVTVASPPNAVLTQASHFTAIMQRALGGADALADWLGDRRLSAFVLGPGFGDADKARAFTRQLADTGRPVVLDADGITAHAACRDALGAAFGGAVRLALTPHEGEFARLFPDLAKDPALSKVDRARAAAAMLNAVVVYKGADTVIAAPDGRSAINADAPAWLATAGSGDVLAGILGGLLAQAMPVFEAACAAVAMHGLAARRAGIGMTAEDLAGQVRPPDHSAADAGRT
ncbi:bifunctional ADP-dependent NAD(P)H-hydrate dehydratase/NAD(P)H-hydrate epimerase [Hoeflea olei]|uniref:Bifunctional NAD(P)H-hydrate repair enzyme n=1 Tax=Hoeflea olei TaxID=1480615 RepID=A0A1C1YZ31_9HYPH|nr:bifunctional ADP-dependent NAD(P)H-hydrate dehydratase/NAD(P)H-hydrate epimerase [Hoeflea olei]OCW58793.1 bifunctional ADP-dependent (S)-NAD(P)H-hydrate dehydratase/NAD(P)H-hydrate epimerase [Hoeflea olei]